VTDQPVEPLTETKGKEPSDTASLGSSGDEQQLADAQAERDE
jgi:hypothetical protein